jgi:hypothetical protein
MRSLLPQRFIFSNKTTLAPACEAHPAAIKPDAPPPTTITSAIFMGAKLQNLSAVAADLRPAIDNEQLTMKN